MKVSLNWLKNYVTTGISTQKFAHKLTMAGLEVEKISSVNGDSILELEITPNRPDCLSMLGLAREAAAILNKPLKFPKIKKRVWPKQKCSIEISDKQGCPRYIGTVIENISIKKANEKINKNLKVLGMRPINNVVDIVNFCLMETGQPLHAFDYDKLVGGKIIVRRARNGEKIVTIDDVERELEPSILVIADERRPVAIAGIMGGKDTEVTSGTKNILLESAYFDPVLIRRASRKLGLNSDSSYRFERGVDFDMVEGGANRAIDLILEEMAAKVTRRYDMVPLKKKRAKRQVTLSIDWINSYIGASLTIAQCKNILIKLGFHITVVKTGVLKITPPSFRNDIKEAVDIVEEITRIVGYDQLPLSFPQVKSSQILLEPKRKVRQYVRELFLAQGFNEIITYTMINRKNLENSAQGEVQGIAIYNPLTQDQEIMRPSMLPSFLSIILSNINRGRKNIKFFEIGKIYTAKGEKDVVGIIMTGLMSDDWRQLEKKKVDYYDLKGSIEQLFERKGIKRERIQFNSSHEECFSPGESAHISVEGKQVGVIGKIEDNVLTKWDIKQKDVFFAQIDFENLYRLKNIQTKYKPISEFPVISRDISLAVKTNVTAQDIEKSIYETARARENVLLSDVKFVELYEGGKIPRGHRGLIFSLTYQSRLAKTLRDDEVEQVHNKVCSALINDLGVIQR